MSPLLDLPDLAIVALNVVLIPVIHLGLSLLFTRMPRTWFDPQHPLYTEKPGENGGRLYETAFHIRRWKNAIPDGATWFTGGFAKKLTSTDPAFVRDFIAETCRGEAAHLAQLIALLGLLAWNPWPANLVIIVYAFLSNFPCIILQRHTRFRLQRFLGEA